jgi:hypothetical protein
MEPNSSRGRIKPLPKLRRITLLSTSVNNGKKKAGTAKRPGP